jgi:hypothetical protein
VEVGDKPVCRRCAVRCGSQGSGFTSDELIKAYDSKPDLSYFQVAPFRPGYPCLTGQPCPSREDLPAATHPAASLAPWRQRTSSYARPTPSTAEGRVIATGYELAHPCSVMQVSAREGPRFVLGEEIERKSIGNELYMVNVII